jgi:hypothetical protein
MNKKIGIAIALVLLLVVAGVALVSRKAQPVSQTNQTESNVTPEAKGSTPQSLAELLMGTAQECRFSTEAATGTVHVANKKMRADIVTTGKEASTTHMITDGTTSYFWVEGTGTGYKMSFDLTEATDTQKTQQPQAVDINQKYDYSCSSWTADATTFELPANITFTDMSKLTIPTTKAKTSGETTKEQCDACDAAPESYRAQCKQALGCN